MVEKIGKIRLLKIRDSTDFNTTIPYGLGNQATELNYTKYQIKETDMRVKTATFTSPDYIDLTTGQYIVRISSKYHENFSGLILDVDYDPETALYNYQCQDWSRLYIEQIQLMEYGKKNIYNLLVSLLTHIEIDIAYKGKVPNSFPYSVKKYWKDQLSGLRSLDEYNQSLYSGNKYKGNPMKNKPKIIIRSKPNIEIIRDLVYSQLGFFDVWFNDRGVLQIEPLSKTDWESTGLHLTTGSALKQKYKFSTTNAITRAFVQGSGTSGGKGYNLDDVKSGALDLTMFFGMVSTGISDPIQKNTTSAASTTSNSTKTNTTNTNTTTNKDNPYGTKNKEVWLTIDTIHGQSTDLQYMKNVASYLQKAGWTTHVYSRVGPSSHYQQQAGYSLYGKVKNAVWFTIYGGACACTLREQANASYYRKPLVDRGSRSVVGFAPPAGDIRKGGKYYKVLGRAHDDNACKSDPTIHYPAQYLTDHAIPFMYGSSAKEMANKFLAGGDNPEACTKDWKFYNRGGFYSGG